MVDKVDESDEVDGVDDEIDDEIDNGIGGGVNDGVDGSDESNRTDRG